MKRVILLFILLSSQTSFAQTLNLLFPEVHYAASRLMTVDENTFTITGGSRWIANRLVIAVNMSEVIIVVDDLNISGVAYFNGFEMNVRHGGGEFFYNTGKFTSVIDIDTARSYIMLADSSLWKVASESRETVSNWLPPFNIILTESETAVINLHRLESAVIRKLK